MPNAREETDGRWTVQGANTALPYLSRVVGDIVLLHGRIVRLRRRMEAQEKRAPARLSEDHPMFVRYRGEMLELKRFVAELDDLGANLMCFESGKVHLPAHYAPDMSLVYHLGDGRIKYYCFDACGSELYPIGKLKEYPHG